MFKLTNPIISDTQVKISFSVLDNNSLFYPISSKHNIFILGYNDKKNIDVNDIENNNTDVYLKDFINKFNNVKPVFITYCFRLQNY